ncbi:adhesin [Escherichia coli]|uniref:Adhesin n=1 Tax=Escherichia coli TaxID=562 RepID=A0A377DF98_ECOLX|nr:adhesin [Escherichia coli]
MRKEFVDDNRVKVNNDGNFVNDLSGRRGIYQAAIKASFSSTFSGHLGVGYSHGGRCGIPVERGGWCELVVLTIND